MGNVTRLWYSLVELFGTNVLHCTWLTGTGPWLQNYIVNFTDSLASGTGLNIFSAFFIVKRTPRNPILLNILNGPIYWNRIYFGNAVNYCINSNILVPMLTNSF